MNELDLYLAVLRAAPERDIETVHAAFWQRETDTATLTMLAARYGVEVQDGNS